MTQPALRDVKVEFRGLRTARVYPEQLPNLPPNAQQIILGRYLPEGRDQTGEAIFSGVQGGKRVQFAAKISLKDDEAGNSFIPRLWARMHLDALLEQGASPAVRDQIVALSEQYHIITPYTSLLVLESDADRERFKVARQFRMRDGEQFFAQGRGNANWELLAQQMKRSAAWRSDLRREALRQLDALGRDVQAFQAIDGTGLGGYFGGMGGAFGGMMGGGMGGMGGEAGMHDLDLRFHAGEAANPGQANTPGVDPFTAVDPSAIEPEENADEQAQRLDAGDEQRVVISEESEKKLPVHRANGAAVPSVPGDAGSGSPLFEGLGLAASASNKGLSSPRGCMVPGAMGGGMMGGMGGAIGGMGAAGAGGFQTPDQGWRERAAAWIALFPAVLPIPANPPALKTSWPVEARSLARSLLRTNVVNSAQKCLRIEIDEQYFDTHWNDVLSRSQAMILISPSAWLVRTSWTTGPTPPRRSGAKCSPLCHGARGCSWAWA